ncbi:MAG TPA: FAD:protein FMN transferase [Terriglobia bacterium]|nr:FAD:protein FMN transferase [Terriglobia bacterium]
MTDPPKAAPLTRRQLLLGLGAAGAAAAVGKLLWPFGRGALPGPDGLQAAGRTGFALGAQMSTLALHENRTTAEEAVQAAFAELQTVESVMSLYRPQSQLCRLNREGVLLRPHPYLVRVLEKARTMSAASGGDFDITVQPLWTLYASAKQNGRLPSAAEIERARRLVDWRRVEVRVDRIQLKHKGTAVTLNGIAQGFAADRALEALAAKGVRHALVDTGEIGALGRRRDGELWTVGIRHPRHQEAYISRAGLDGRCVATSGDYATTFSPDRVHNHIFDPRTGCSPNVFQSVTVLARSGLEADALSTAVFVAGFERGIKLIEASPGAEALFVLKSGETRATSGFPGKV